MPPGPLAEGIFTVIDRAARYRTASDARALVSALMGGYGGAAQPVTAVPGAVVFAGRFRIALPGGQVTGNEALVIIERDPFVFTDLIVGGGSRPDPSDAQALANLQAGAIQSPRGSS